MSNHKYSLYYIVGISIVLTITLIISLYATYSYMHTKNKMLDDMKYTSSVSLISLKKNVATYIESYLPNEYENLVQNEMGHKDIFAIVVEDYNMGKILGTDKYITGKIKDDTLEIIDFEPDNEKHLNILNECFYIQSYDIPSHSGENIGKITLYISDYYMEKELSNIIISNIISAVVISIILILILFFTIKYLVLEPIYNIIKAITLNSQDGIPTTNIPSGGSKEIFLLSNTMNNMISSIKYSRNALIQSEQRYSSLLDSMTELVFIKDSNLRYLVTNKALEDFFGKSKDELFYKTDFELMGQESAQYCYASDMEALKNKKQVISQEQIGDIIYETHKFPVQLDENHIGLGCFIVDITEKKAQEKAILESKEKLEVTIEASKIGLWEWDIPQDKVIWDKNCFLMLGYKEDSFTINFEKWQSLIHPDDLSDATKSVQLQLIQGHTFIVEFRYKKADNSWIWVEGRGRVIQRDGNNNPVKMVGTHLDISHTKEYEQRLKSEVEQKTKELYELNQTLEERIAQEVEKNRQQDAMLQQQSRLAAMGEMMGNIAHQWRQPLSAITSSISALKLKDEFGLLESDDIKQTNDSIIKSAEFLSKTIENFRNFFKKDQPKKDFNIADSIYGTIGIIKASYDSNFIVLDYNLDDSLSCYGSENLLSQVLLNILSNAKDAFVNNSSQDRFVTISMFKEDSNIKITVQDNAGGIPDNIKEKIFDPYFTTKHQTQGTGLGLYMSSQIIKNHFDGELSVENIETPKGKGACFVIEFPIAQNIGSCEHR